MDYIESIGFEVDTDHEDDPQGYLTISGDFVQTFKHYLDDKDAETIKLRLFRSDAEELHTALGRYL